MEKFFIQDFRNLEAGSKVEGVFAVRRKNALQQYKGKSGYYFKIEVSDKTGSITVNFWGRESREEVEEVYDSFDNDDLVFISALLSYTMKK
jgi:RPA family protein